MISKTWAALLIGSTVVPAASLAQAPTQRLDSVVVADTRLRTPLAHYSRDLQVLDRARIEALPVKSTAELLAYAAGVDLRQRGPWGAQADVSIDGSTFDQVLVLVNGVKISDPQTGHNMLNALVPLAAVERIEVLRGPAARTYGVNALAGAINIVTREPDAPGVFAQVQSGSSFQQDTATGATYYGTGVQLATTRTFKGSSHLLAAAYDRGNGYRYNTAFEASRVFYQNRIRLQDRTHLEMLGGYTDNQFGASLFYAAPGDNEATERVKTALGSVALVHEAGRLRLVPRVSYRYNQDEYIYIRQKPEVFRNFHETHVVTGELNGSYRLRQGTLGAGAELRYDGIRSTNLGIRDRRNAGAFLEYRHRFAASLEASAGVYLNYNSDFGSQLYPGIDLNWQPTARWQVYASSGSGQRLPTYTDLYYQSRTNIGNPDLRPEEAWYAEGGVRYKADRLQAQASHAYRRISDFIDWTRSLDSQPWEPRNYQTVTTSVTTLRATYDAARWLRVIGSYTYLEPSVAIPTSSLSKYTINALRHQAIASAQVPSVKNWQAMVTARYQQRINGADYTLLDARLGYTWRRLLVYADANNLLDQQYSEAGAVPLPGRWLALGVRFNSF